MLNSYEQAFKADVASENASFARRFLPYFQPYEFEGLLFADIAKLSAVESAWRIATTRLLAVREGVQSPEHINDGYDTKPSAQLKKHLSSPQYRKTLHGPIAIEAIGIDTLLSECCHFSGWYSQLLALN